MTAPVPPFRSVGWLRIEAHLNWRHRLTVTVPMAALGLIDDLVGLLTLGFVQPGLALDWGFRQSLYNHRKHQPEPSLPDDPAHSDEP